MTALVRIVAHDLGVTVGELVAVTAWAIVMAPFLLGMVIGGLIVLAVQ